MHTLFDLAFPSLELYPTAVLTHAQDRHSALQIRAKMGIHTTTLQVYINQWTTM